MMMKYRMIVPILTFLTITACVNNSRPVKKIKWINKKIFKYSVSIPANYSIYYLRDSSEALITNGNVKIQYVPGYIIIDGYVRSKSVFRVERISTFKKIILDSVSDHGSIMDLALWDTTTALNLIDHMRYRGCIMDANDVPISERNIVLRIFTSLAPQKDKLMKQ